MWSKAATFTSFATNVGVVDTACTAGGDPNPPSYNSLQYTITCGTRFCNSLGYFFGLIVESVGLNVSQPYYSPSSAFVQVDCSK